MKYMVYCQCELYECAYPYYDKLMKRMCNSILVAYEKSLALTKRMSREVALQVLFEFDFLADVFKGVMEKEQEEIAIRCKQLIWKAAGAGPEGALAEDEKEEKKKQTKILKYKSEVILQSFIPA